MLTAGKQFFLLFENSRRKHFTVEIGPVSFRFSIVS